MFQAANFGVFFFVGGIQLAPFVEFLEIRHDDPFDRVIGVVPVNQGLVIIIGTEYKFIVNLLQFPFFRFGQLGNLVQFC